MRCLLYTLVNYRKRQYVEIFRAFLRALAAFSDVRRFDLCVVSDATAIPSIRALEEWRAFERASFIEVLPAKSLADALLRKFDVF